MGNAKPVSVDIVLKVDTSKPNGIKFDMVSDLKQGDELTFKNDKKGDWFEVDFNIVDPDGTGYVFPDDETKAMYVTPVNTVTDPCPDDWNCPEYWPQFCAQKVTKNNRTLTVKNLNETVQLYKFCFWLTKTPKDNGPCIPYDPIGSNQNAGSGKSFLSAPDTTLLVGAAVVIAVAVVVYSISTQ